MQLLIRVRDLVVTRAHVSRPRQQIGVERMQLGDTGLERAQTPGALFLPVNFGVDVPQDVIELRRLTDGAIYHLAPLLQHRDLLRDVIGEGLQRAHLSLGVGRVRRGLREMGEPLLEPGHAGLRCSDASLHLLLSLLERVQPGGRSLTGAIQFVLALPRAVERVGEVAHLARERVRVGAQRFEDASRFEQAREIALQRERPVERGAQPLDLGTKGLDLSRCMLDLRFGAALYARHPFGLLVERGQDGDEPLKRLHAPLHLRYDLLGLGDRLRKLRELLSRVTSPGGERLERDALALHLSENGAKLRRELRRGGLVSEELPGHCSPHVEEGGQRWCRGIAVEARRMPGSAFAATSSGVEGYGPGGG